MRGSVAKIIRRELVPREKLETLREPGQPRVSRGKFMRATVHGQIHAAPKQETGLFRGRQRWAWEVVEEEHPDDFGNVWKSKGLQRVKVRAMPQYRLNEGPRLAAKIIKRRYKDGIQRS